MLAWIYFPTVIFFTIFLATTALVLISGVKADQRQSVPWLEGTIPASYACVSWTHQDGGPGICHPPNQVLLMLLPLVQALKNLLEPHSPAQLCVWRCCRVVGTGWKAKTAWAASVSSPVVSRIQPWTHAHSARSHTKK